jgi:small subunit ribosomal protein S2
MVKLPTMEEMLKAGMHFGHKTSRWHPKAASFIFGERNGVHIIDLEKSRQMLGHALEHITKSVKEGKIILFVGTKTQVKNRLKNICVEIGMPYISEKWPGGCITNFVAIKKSIKRYNDILEMKKTDKLAKYTKKEKLEFDREAAKLETRIGGLAKISKVPDIIFIWDIKKEKTAVKEALKKNIPIIAVCDTNTNPEVVDYVIPSNDDATKAIKLVLGLVKEAVEEGKGGDKK